MWAAGGADAETGVGEGGVGEGGHTAEDVAEVDGTVAALDGADADAAALDGFPPFFFVMVGCLGYRISSRQQQGARQPPHRAQT